MLRECFPTRPGCPTRIFGAMPTISRSRHDSHVETRKVHRPERLTHHPPFRSIDAWANCPNSATGWKARRDSKTPLWPTCVHSSRILNRAAVDEDSGVLAGAGFRADDDLDVAAQSRKKLIARLPGTNRRDAKSAEGGRYEGKSNGGPGRAALKTAALHSNLGAVPR